MLQGGNSISIHLQPSFRNSLTFGHFPTSRLDSLVAARMGGVGILHVEQETNILAGKRRCAPVKSSTIGNFSPGFSGGERHRRLLPPQN
jgi:hypothetical protein